MGFLKITRKLGEDPVGAKKSFGPSRLGEQKPGPPPKKTGLPSWPEKKNTHRISLPVVDSGIFIPVFVPF